MTSTHFNDPDDSHDPDDSDVKDVDTDASARRALDIVRGARNIVFFTGAGMSAQSGLAVYRNDDTGLWENVNPLDMASIDAWNRDPAPMWAWYLWRAHKARAAQPNAGHLAIAALGTTPGWRCPVVTQNIDDLHERAGSTDVVHLHGSLFEFACTAHDHAYPTPPLPTQPENRLTPPACPECGSPIRPKVVWFGEGLDPARLDRAEDLLTHADAVIIVGTSGTVQPAASLPLAAIRRGIPTIDITPAPTAFADVVDYTWDSTAAQALPVLAHGLTQ